MEILAIPKRQLSAVCSIDKGTLTVQDRPPVFTGENGAMEIVVTFKRNGTNYSIPSGVVATMYLYYPNTEIMTIASEMAVSGATATGLLSEVMVAKEGYPMLFVQLTDSETGDVIVAASYPIKVTKSRGKYVIDTRPPSPSEVVYVGKSPYINIQNNHWMEWDTETLQYKDSGVQADGYPPFINLTDKCWMVWDAENDEYINTHIKAEGENNIDDTAGAGDTDSAWSANKLVAEFSGKVPTTRQVNGHALTDDITVSKSDVGLGNVDNTSDTDKPISTATQTALDAKVPTSRKVNGHALTSDIDISAHEITASGIGDKTVEGNPLVVEDAIEATAKKIVVGLEPIQDLHGYDAPWPAGGGKNKCSLLDVTFVQFKEFEIDEIPAGTYIYSGVVTSNDTDGSNCAIIFLDAEKNVLSSKALDRSTGTTRVSSSSFTTSVPIKYLRLYASSGYPSGEGDTATFKDNMIESGDTATSFAPYSNICPISGRTGVEVTRTGKNLLKLVESEMISIGWNRVFPLTLKTGTYTMSCQSKLYIGGANKGCKIAIVRSDNSIIRDIFQVYGYGSGTMSFTFEITDSDASQMGGIAFQPNANGSAFSDYDAMQNMIELGSTATAYEPYQGETYPITFPTEAGTVYGGELTVHNDGTGELVVDKFLYVYDGTEPFNKSGTALNGFYNQLTVATPHNWPIMFNYNISTITITDEKSSMFISTRNSNTYKQNIGYYYIDSGHNFNVPPEMFGTTVESFKAKLAELYAAGTPVSVFCKIATPITYTLTATQVQLLEAYNCLFTDGNSLSLTYLGSEASNVQDEIDEFERVTNNILASIAPVETSTASASHAIGSYIMLNNQFCKVTTAISAGETIAIGRNVTKTTLAQELLAIINS